MVVLYNVRMAYTHLKKINSANNTYKTCKWIYKFAQMAFPRRKITVLQNFLGETLSREEMVKVEVVKFDSDSSKEATRRAKPEMPIEAIMEKIDALWNSAKSTCAV